jgi:hypothetical protein
VQTIALVRSFQNQLFFEHLKLGFSRVRLSHLAARRLNELVTDVTSP